VKSCAKKPLEISFERGEAELLMSAFGTVELRFANLMLGNVINAACDGSPARPPGSEDINRALAAVGSSPALAELLNVAGDMHRLDAVKTSEPSCFAPAEEI
jgi:hypothetical protein